MTRVTGKNPAVVDLDGIKIGLLVRFDVEFPEVARSLALALENGLPHIYVNQVGVGETFVFSGGSMIVSADGDRLVEAGPLEAVIPFRLAFSARRPAKPEHLRPEYLQQRRSPLPVKSVPRTSPSPSNACERRTRTRLPSSIPGCFCRILG